MSISYRNTINTGIHGPSTGQNPLEACFPQSPCPFWAGLQPFGYIAGTQDCQGSLGYPKWKNTDWLTSSIGTGGAPTQDLTPVGRTATRPNQTATIVTDNAADGDGWMIQFSMDGGTTADLAFLPTAGQLLLVYGRFKKADAGSSATVGRFYMGLVDATTDWHNDIGSVDSAAFYKASGAATMVGQLVKAGTATATAALANSIADDTYISLGMRINGVSSVEFWQGTTAHDMTLSATQTTMTNIADEALALAFQIEASSTSAQTVTLQHLVAFQEAL